MGITIVRIEGSSSFGSGFPGILGRDTRRI
jgi:hypothetical protein